jgi:two-component system nitrogen regulation response regulator GlnG
MKNNGPSISEFLSKHLESYFAIHNGDIPNTGLYNLVLSEVEKVTIAETLKHTCGVQAKAAAILGISRNTLRKKMSEFGVELY